MSGGGQSGNINAQPGVIGDPRTGQISVDQDRNKMLALLAHALQGLASGVSYVQGTWVPSLVGSSTSGAPTYTAQVGTYERIGREVQARFYLAWSALGGATGNVLVGGLPYIASTTVNDLGGVLISGTTGITFSGGYTQLTGAMSAVSASTAAITQLGSGVSGLALPISGVASTGSLSGVILYDTSSNSGTAQQVLELRPTGSLPPLLSASQELMNIAMKTGDALPTNLAGSLLDASTAPTADAVFTLYKNGGLICTGTISAGQTTGSWGAMTAQTFVDHDRLKLLAPSIADVTMADVAWTILGTRTQ